MRVGLKYYKFYFILANVDCWVSELLFAYLLYRLNAFLSGFYAKDNFQHLSFLLFEILNFSRQNGASILWVQLLH